MANQNHRVTILVAIIGLGTVSATVLSNWDKIFGAPVLGTTPAPLKPNQGDIPLVEVQSTVKPSFDCAKASSNAERLVCSSLELAVLDLSISNAYRDAIAATNKQYERTQLKDAQIFWLREVRGRCEDVVCLRNAYEVHIEELRDATR